MMGGLLALVLAASAAAPPADDHDIDPVEPDFTVINLPTNLRLPRHALAFRLTHRFARGLGEGDFGDLLADFFGFDGGAQIGLELRFSPFTGNQLGIYRTSDRTIEFFAQQQLLRETDAPVGLGLLGSIEGLDNFSETYSPRVGVVVSRRLGRRGAIYASPAWIGNVRPASDPATSPDDEDGTLLVGLGARIRLAETFSIVGEIHPRLAGYTGSENGAMLASFGFEGRVGGHVFQLNFSNDLGTTPAQVARGRLGLDDWFIGFNISRKFY
jgi:hypothetical protein